MSVTREKLVYSKEQGTFVRVRRSRGYSLPDLFDVYSRQDDETTMAIPLSIPSRRKRLKGARIRSGTTPQFKKAFQQQKLLDIQERLDAAVGFDDDLGEAIAVMNELIHMLYANDCIDEFECLRCVRQIASAEDRAWKNPTNDSTKINSYDDLQMVSIFVLYDHQRRSKDVDLAKDLAGFLTLRHESGCKIPAKINVRKFTNTSGFRKGGSDRDMALDGNIFQWLDERELPSFIEWLYDRRSPLMTQIFEGLPAFVRAKIGSGCNRDFVHSRSDQNGGNRYHEIAVSHWVKSTGHFISWAISFLTKVPGHSQYGEEAKIALEGILKIKSEGIKTLTELREQADRGLSDWREVFSLPKP